MIAPRNGKKKGIDSLDGIRIGDTFTRDGRDRWTVEIVCHIPTIMLRNTATGEQIHAAVGAPALQEMMPLRKQLLTGA